MTEQIKVLIGPNEFYRFFNTPCKISGLKVYIQVKSSERNVQEFRELYDPELTDPMDIDNKLAVNRLIVINGRNPNYLKDFLKQLKYINDYWAQHPNQNP